MPHRPWLLHQRAGTENAHVCVPHAWHVVQMSLMQKKNQEFATSCYSTRRLSADRCCLAATRPELHLTVGSGGRGSKGGWGHVS